MAIYFLLGTLTSEGQKRLADRPNFLHEKEVQEVLENEPQARILGHYHVLGQYDVLTMVEAADNAAVARVSSALGSTAGLHFRSLTAVSVHPNEEPALVREPRPDKDTATAADPA